ncbi:MAG: glycosyltransferase 87 family protein [Lachnospiraceae bacterium]|nr:glycosyltransferase 87 family protein [Lachnospiraceae bacterium]
MKPDHKKIKGLSPLWKKTSFVFVVLMTISILALLAVFLFTRGEAMEHFWFHSPIDTGMDFFHSIEYVRGRSPYEIFGTLYPPLANLFFLFIYAFIPESVAENWTYNFEESVNLRQTVYDLRTYQSCMMMFLIFVIFVTFMVAILVRRYFQKKGNPYAGACACCFVLSYGVLQALERGNIVILAAGFSLFFVSFYRSDNKVLKELALISLAFAAGLKVYPCLLGVLLLKEKDAPVIIRTIIYGIAAFVLPCFAFREGLGAIPMWLNILINHTNSLESPWLGIGISNAFADGAHLIDTFFGTGLANASFSIAGILVAVVFLIIALFLKKTWMSALAITFAMLFQDQGSYFLCMALVPLMLFLGEEKEFTRENIIPFVILMIIALPLPILYTYNVCNPRNTMIHIAMPVFLIWGLLYVVKNRKDSDIQ